MPFEDDNDQKFFKQYYLSTVEIEYYNVMIYRRNQPIKSDLKLYDNIRNISTGQGDDYTTACLLDYTCFKKWYKLIAVDLSKHHKLDAHPKAIQQLNFTGNLDIAETSMFFITKEKTDFSKKEQSKYYDLIFFVIPFST